MPTSSKAKLAYQREYNARQENIKKRSANNAARRKMVERHGLAAVKGKDVAHKRALANGGSNADSNIGLSDVASNRGWRAGRKGYSVPNTR